MKTKRHFIATGHIAGSLEEDLEENPNQENGFKPFRSNLDTREEQSDFSNANLTSFHTSSLVYCNHKSYCPLKKNSMKCLFGKEHCRTFHFYNKYGENGNLFGVGS